MKNITLRGIDEELEKALRKRAQNKKESVNKTILNILKKETGQSEQKPFNSYDDLNDLAGTWSEADLEEFENNTGSFNQIDAELWK